MQFEENEEKPLFLQGKKNYFSDHHLMNQNEEKVPKMAQKINVHEQLDDILGT